MYILYGSVNDIVNLSSSKICTSQQQHMANFLQELLLKCNFLHFLQEPLLNKFKFEYIIYYTSTE